MADRVYDFCRAAETERETAAVTYTLFQGETETADAEHPLLVLSEKEQELRHHECGYFPGEGRRTAFHYIRRDVGEGQADILSLDSRFRKLVDWLGENGTMLRLSGKRTEAGFAVYRLRIIDARLRSMEPVAGDALLQLMLSRLLSLRGITAETEEADSPEEKQNRFLLSDPQEMTDFLHAAGDTLPRQIRLWARRNLQLLSSGDVSPEEKRHSKRALSMMLSVSWQGSYFPPIDPVRARQILDEELYGLTRVKQRIIETIIQINRTHTLPAYGLLLVGPAGTGKSQIAYAVARILGLPWTALDMSAIHDAEALTGSPRLYANAKPGRIMEAFAEAGSSNLVFLINELDKAEGSGSNGNPADALLTLLDNLGYTDNYVECVIPTSGVYPIATANDKSKISDPLMTRFAVIELPDYSREEKRTIFRRFALPRTLRRLGMREEECLVQEEAVEVLLEKYGGCPGCRDLEQAAEQLAAHALYRIETEGLPRFCFDEARCRALFP